MDRPDQIPEDQIVEFYRDQISESDSLSSDCVDDILTYATRLEARVKELEAILPQWKPVSSRSWDDGDFAYFSDGVYAIEGKYDEFTGRFRHLSGLEFVVQPTLFADLRSMVRTLPSPPEGV